MRVFISFSSKDVSFIQTELIPFLHLQGIGTWWSNENIRASEDWERKILAGLRSCDWFMVVMSPRSVQSEWVRAEFRWAIEERNGRIIPLLLRECKPYDLHLRLPGIQHLDFRTEKNQAFENLGLFFDNPCQIPAEQGHGVVFDAAHATLLQPQELSTKVVRLGCKFGLLTNDDGPVALTGAYITKLCDVAERFTSTEFHKFLTEGWIPLHVAAAGSAKTGPIYESDFIDMVAELSGAPLTTYLMKVGCDAKILRLGDDGFRPTDELIEEMFEIISDRIDYGDFQSKEYFRPHLIESLVELANARLVINCNGLRNHRYILALLLYSVFGLEEIVQTVLAKMTD